METQALILAALFVVFFSIIGFALSNTIVKVRELEKRAEADFNLHQIADRAYIKTLQKKAADWETRYKGALSYVDRLEQKLSERDLEVKDKDAQINKLKFDYACEVAGGKNGEKEPLKFVNFEGECPACHGHGKYRKPFTENEMVGCVCCGGTGKAHPGKESRKTPRKKGVIVDCPDCNGEAADPSGDKVCATCNGNGEIKL